MRITVYRPTDDLTDTRYGKLLAAGAETLPLYLLTAAGRIQRLTAIADPDPGRTERAGAPCYLTERSPRYAYAIGQYVGHFTPEEAVAEAIGAQTRLVERARAKLAKLEAALARYNAAAEALQG